MLRRPCAAPLAILACTAALAALPPGARPGQARADHVAYQWLDVPYAKVSPRQRLDIFTPDTGQKPYPVIVFVHGGAFMAGDKADVQVGPALRALGRGYAVVSINYRLSGDAPFPAQLQDVKAAIRWVRGHAGTYGFDPARVVAWGSSAGGSLVALAGTTGGVAEFEDARLGYAGESSRVQAVVDWFGPIDFLTLDEQFTKSGLGPADHGLPDSPEARLFGAPPASVPDRAKAANASLYLTPDDPPFFIEHGTRDPRIPTEQSIQFAAAIERVLGKEHVELHLVEGAGHGGAPFETPENVDLVLTFLDRVFGIAR